MASAGGVFWLWASPAWRSVGLRATLRARETSSARKNTSVILLWLDGGPSHMDLYDMKPDAPAEYRGIWKPIRTRVPGFDITELFPKQAKVTDKFSMVRSLHHDTGDHFAGGHRMLTAKDMGVSGANNTGKFPGHRRHRQPRSWDRGVAACRAMSPSPMPAASDSIPATSAATCSAPSTTPSSPAATPMPRITASTT